MLKILKLPFTILAYIFGSINWSAPPWLLAFITFAKKKPKLLTLLLILAISSVAVYYYLSSLPKPLSIKATTNNIQITLNKKGAKYSPLIIKFDYDLSLLTKEQAKPEGQASVAKINLINKEISHFIDMSPSKKGKWTWLDDRRMQFTAETDWPAGTTYLVSFNMDLFSKNTLLSQPNVAFSTPELNTHFSHIELYQDPLQKSVRQVVATAKFSHPIDKDSFESSLSISMIASDKNTQAKPQPFSFSIKYDKNFREAYITTAKVPLPKHTSFMNLRLKPGVKSLLGGQSSKHKATSRMVIPDRYSFLKISYINLSIIKNQKEEPEQLIVVEFSDAINRQEVLDKLSLYLLPKQGQPMGRNSWRNTNNINSKVLKHSKKINYQLIENERNYSKVYSLIIDEPEYRKVYMHIKEGLTSQNDYVKNTSFQRILHVPEYPIELNIMGDGSVLSLSGQHKLNVLSRGAPALKHSIGRLLDNQITHLISQTNGDISNPQFNNWSFNEENIAHISSSTVILEKRHPKEANYSSFDLSRYLPKDKKQLGLYFIDIGAWDHKNRREIYSEHEKRLILMTDLGIIVKNNADQTHDVFVQSISTGKPVSGATVSLLGKNGQTIMSQTTSELGHTLLPSTNGFYQQKQPSVYLVKTENDLSFIPFQREARFINTSKFDVGGVSSYRQNNKSLKSFMFSDRGIYRPGETVNLGMIVKRFDFSNVEDIPLELVIRNARNKTVKTHKFHLDKKGFNDYQFKTDVTSPTGRYFADLHIIDNRKYRGESISHVNFKVEEFKPDTLKIRSQFESVATKGWLTKNHLNANVTLNNLFGTPAQNRKVTANVRISPYNFNFKTYSDYNFSNPFAQKDKTPLSINKRLKQQNTDADGIAQFHIDLDAFNEGTYQLHFNSEGFDASGGRSVKTSQSVLISPLVHLVGSKPSGKLDYINKNSERSIHYIAINSQLGKIDLNELTLKIAQINTISTLVKQANGTYKYQNIEKEIELSRQTININQHGYQHIINTTQAGNFSIEILDSANKRVTKQLYSVVGFANLTGKIDQQSTLQLKLNKSDYLPGEIIEMSIKAPYMGAGLITIESNHVHHFKWFSSDTHSSIQTIKLPDDIEGNAYISISFIRDKESAHIFKNPLSYAIQPFSIDKSKRRVDITLDTKEIVRPGKSMSIKYSTSKPSRIAIFAINEGILQVARYKTPNPLGHFLQKNALAVETMQILDLILPDFDLSKFLSASGGGADAAMRALAKNLNPFTRKLDKPAVYWSGIYDADLTTKEVKFNIPSSFAGQLRIMAVAVAEEAVGANSQHALVRGPFVISPNVLNHAAPNDEFFVTVGIANIIKGSGKQAEVNLNITASKHLKILGDINTKLLIDEGSEGKYTFKVKALNQLGNATLHFKAQHKNDSSIRSASFSIRPATHYVSSFNSGYANNGSIDLTIPRLLKTDLAQQSIAASASPLLLVDGLSAYLEHFPHGCTEQVVSKVFPLIGLMSHPAYGENNAKVNQYFNHLIDKLGQRQQSDGGFAFWSGANNSAHYPSIYAMHFLLDAKEQAFSVPKNMLQRGKQYLSFSVQQRANSLLEARNKANAIYLLTRMGMVTSNHLIDLEENLNTQFKDQWQHDILASYMAATYQLLQQDNAAKRLINGYKIANENHLALNDFHSVLALDAQYIYLISKHFKQKAKQLDLNVIHKLTEQIFKGEYNTLSAAYSILALGAYSELALNNNFNENISFKAIDHKNQKSDLNAQQNPFLKASYNHLQKRLLIEAEQALFYLNVQSGFDQQLPTQAIANGIEVYREFVDEKGNLIEKFEQGKEVTINLKVRALKGKTITNIALVDLLPAGFEAIRSSLSRSKLSRYGFSADYIDIREDRIVIYGSFSSSIRTISYKAKMTAAGQFIVPPVYAESMYDRSIKAHSKVDKINVIKAP